MLGRIERFRQRRTDLPTLILELHLFVETYDGDDAAWTESFHAAWEALAGAAGPVAEDPLAGPPADPKGVERHLATLERLLRRLA
jgi:hypothetical protein